MALSRLWTDLLQGLVSSHGAMILLCSVLSYHALLAVYRLSPLHPLHKFPGPKLAAASYLYEIWFDLVKGGQYTFEIKRLHDTYGKLKQNGPGTAQPLNISQTLNWELIRPNYPHQSRGSALQ